jgi:Zn-dependent M28 family amino/carboxypeptidase
MIECARAVAGRGLRRSVIFVAFDAEERQDPARGLWGSDAFVSGFMKKRGGGDPWNTAGLSAALILEMVGYSAPKGRQRVPLAMRLLFPAAGWRVMRRGYAGDFLVAVTRGRGKNVAQTLSKRSSQAGGPPVLALGLPGWAPIPPDLLRSDHAAFWLAGVPAVMIGDTANFRNPNYHLPSDTPETLDYVMIAGIASALAETVAELANQA